MRFLKMRLQGAFASVFALATGMRTGELAGFRRMFLSILGLCTSPLSQCLGFCSLGRVRLRLLTYATRVEVNVAVVRTVPCHDSSHDVVSQSLAGYLGSMGFQRCSLHGSSSGGGVSPCKRYRHLPQLSQQIDMPLKMRS